jgi:Domain of unknown function (DUF4365)
MCHHSLRSERGRAHVAPYFLIKNSVEFTSAHSTSSTASFRSLTFATYRAQVDCSASVGLRANTAHGVRPQFAGESLNVNAVRSRRQRKRVSTQRSHVRLRPSTPRNTITGLEAIIAQFPDRKRRTREHIIADLSVNHLERFILQCGWVAQRVSPDYGIDLVMDTFDRHGMIENGVVKFQLKATDSPRVLSTRQAVAIRLDWRDVVYWLNERMPVILVVYDAHQVRAWWLYLQSELRRETRKKKRRPSQTLTVHVPLTNRLDLEAVRQFAAFRDAVLAESEDSSS